MIDWTQQKMNRLSELKNDPEGYSENDIAEIMTKEFGEFYSRDAIHNKFHRLDNKPTLIEKPRPEMPYFSKYEELIKGEALPKVFDFYGPYVEISKEKLKVLHLSDTHIPFQIDEQIQTAINRNKTADVVVAVEVSDCYSISRFNKNYSIPLEFEIDYVLRYFEYLNETFPVVLVLAGNHQKRISKELMKRIHPSLLFLMESDLIETLAKPFSHIIICKTPILQINDTIFTHAETISKVDLKASVNVYQMIQEWKDVLDLKDYSCIIQSHTHMLGTTYRGGQCKIMESGCLCYIPDYSIDGFYSKPQTNGYIVIVQKFGVTDMNLTREYTFGTPVYEPNFNPVGGYMLEK